MRRGWRGGLGISAFVLASALAAACGGDDTEGQSADAGSFTGDSGTTANDSGAPIDATIDSGTPHDSGSPTDATINDATIDDATINDATIDDATIDDAGSPEAGVQDSGADDSGAIDTCHDGMIDDGETGIDCGGTSACGGCSADVCTGTGQGNCVSGLYCAAGICGNDSCHDGITDNGESSVDCGGSTCGACGIGKACTIDSDCAPWLCSADVCGLGAGASSVTYASSTVTTVTLTETPCVGTSGTNTLTVGSTTGFAANEIVFIVDMQGSGAGNSEVNRVSTVGSGTLTMSNALSHGYTAASQVIAMPQYASLEIDGTVHIHPWNGSTGGVYPVLVSGPVTITGTLDVSGAGFRGGDASGACVTSAPLTCATIETASAPNGYDGESSSGASAISGFAGTPAVYGANNGAGGGGGTRGQDCAAGGGGSYGTSGGGGANGSVNTGCSYYGGFHNGGLGGTTVGTTDLTSTIFLGAGGGQGGPDEDGVFAGPGGNGGGMIVLFASSLSVSGSINAGGTGGQPGQNTSSCSGTSRGSGSGMGNGGGGSGGAIRLFTASNAILGSALITANGGAGNNGGGCIGEAGGNGGAGRIQIRAEGTTSGTTSPTYSP
jgi:hypothetical protein